MSMKEFKQTTIAGRGSRVEYSDLVIEDCTFESCFSPRLGAPGQWTIFRNVHLKNVSHANCDIDTAKIEDVSLNQLKRLGNNPLFLWSCVFNRVVLSGKISALKINRSYAAGNNAVSSIQEAWDAAVINHYSTVDWALDISEARFSGGVTFEAIPGDKIRINPECQAVVSREHLKDGRWRSLNYGNSSFDIALSWFLDRSLFSSVVLAARTGSRDAKKDIEVLTMLRNEVLAM